MGFSCVLGYLHGEHLQWQKGRAVSRNGHSTPYSASIRTQRRETRSSASAGQPGARCQVIGKQSGGVDGWMDSVSVSTE
ncbi:hypothetical protein IF2G_05925 [Cordyceps javanica]|nr:hypothetical protein IF2G_05925 [Cordyceps javanica]